MKRYIRWEELSMSKEDIEEDEVEEGGNAGLIKNLLTNAVHTPFGIFKADSQLNPMNDRVVLIGNTNFNISAKLIADISDVDGVESIRIVSRYMMIIMVGTLFDENSVVEKINTACEIDVDKVDIENLSDYEADLILKASETEHWLAYMFPNGKEYIENFESEEELKKAVGYFRELNNFSEGRMFCSQKLEDELENDFE